MAPIPGQESQLQKVKDLWGPKASTLLENILTEFDDLFMKHKADIGPCTIAKHPVEVEPGAVPDREGARWFMALEKYHFLVEHRPRTQHRNADGLSKRTNENRRREQRLEKLPPWLSAATPCHRMNTTTCLLRHGSMYRDESFPTTLSYRCTYKTCNQLLPTQFSVSFVARSEPNDEPSNRKHGKHHYRHSFYQHCMLMRIFILIIRKIG